MADRVTGQRDRRVAECDAHQPLDSVTNAAFDFANSAVVLNIAAGVAASECRLPGSRPVVIQAGGKVAAMQMFIAVTNKTRYRPLSKIACRTARIGHSTRSSLDTAGHCTRHSTRHSSQKLCIAMGGHLDAGSVRLCGVVNGGRNRGPSCGGFASEAAFAQGSAMSRQRPALAPIVTVLRIHAGTPTHRPGEGLGNLQPGPGSPAGAVPCSGSVCRRPGECHNEKRRSKERRFSMTTVFLVGRA